MAPNKILGVLMLVSSLATLYAVFTENPYVWAAVGIEVAVLAGLLVVLNRKKPIDDGLAGRPE